LRYANYKYIDTAEGGPRNRNNVVNIFEYKPKDLPDCYRTVFRFDELYLNYFKKSGSVSGYSGKHVADWVPFDIDDANLEMAHKKTSELIDILNMDYDYNVEYLFFSGAKGFHVLIPAQSFGYFEPLENLHNVFRKIKDDIAGELTDNIYDIARLFRYSNTLNSKSGLYKIPLTGSDFNKGIEYIVEIAKKQSDLKFSPFSDHVVNQQLLELYEKHKHGTVAEPKIKGLQLKGVLESGADPGSRNSSAIRIAGLLNSKGLDIDLAYQLLAGWNRGNSVPMDETELKTILQSAYRYENCESELKNDIYPIWSIGDEYRDYVRSEAGVNIGIPEIDEKIRKIRPGQVMTIMGYTGNFKTATLQSMLGHYTKYSHEPVLMFELEMSKLDLFERAVQMEWRHEGSLVEAIFKDDDNLTIEAVMKELQVRYKDFYVVDLPSLNFNDMKKYINVLEETIVKRKVGLVGIDFLQLMSGHGKTHVEAMNNIAKGMKDFAKSIPVPVIVLSQVTDVESSNDVIKLMDSRDTKTIPHMSDYVLGVWLDGDSQVISLLKNRKGGLVTVTRSIDRQTLNFGD